MTFQHFSTFKDTPAHASWFVVRTMLSSVCLLKQLSILSDLIMQLYMQPCTFLVLSRLNSRGLRCRSHPLVNWGNINLKLFTSSTLFCSGDKISTFTSFLHQSLALNQLPSTIWKPDFDSSRSFFNYRYTVQLHV